MRHDPRRDAVREQVDQASAITGGLVLQLGAATNWLNQGHMPTVEMIEALITKAHRLQIALEGCKVDTPERAVSP